MLELGSMLQGRPTADAFVNADMLTLNTFPVWNRQQLEKKKERYFSRRNHGFKFCSLENDLCTVHDRDSQDMSIKMWNRLAHKSCLCSETVNKITKIFRLIM